MNHQSLPSHLLLGCIGVCQGNDWVEAKASPGIQARGIALFPLGIIHVWQVIFLCRMETFFFFRIVLIAGPEIYARSHLSAPQLLRVLKLYYKVASSLSFLIFHVHFKNDLFMINSVYKNFYISVYSVL